MQQSTITLTILGMALVTYLPRFLPMWLLSQRQLPQIWITWLSYVPVAVFSAMLMPQLLLQDNALKLGADNLFLWMGALTFAFAWRTRSFMGTIVAGMGAVALSRYLMGGGL